MLLLVVRLIQISKRGSTVSKKGSEIIVESLENHHVPYIFGIPGAKIDGVFDTLEDHECTIDLSPA